MKIRTACTRDCPDACGIIATVEDGKVVKLQGDPKHPITKGFLCHRTSRFLERQYSPNRLLTPLLRKEKSGTTEEISLNDALDLAAEKLRHFRDRFGGQSIMQYRCGGSIGIMKQLGDYFFSRFGPVCTKGGDICSGAGETAQLMDFGELDSNDFFDIHNSKTIFLWGKNLHVSNVHLIPEIKKAQKNGVKVIAIDSVATQTSALADFCLKPAPGKDGAIALGIVRWLLENENLNIQAKNYCDHWDEFLELSNLRSVKQWADLAEISIEDLEYISECYADGPCSILMGWGMQRRRFGGTTIRLLDGLATVSGNIGRAGGGASFYYGRRTAFNYDFSVAEKDWPKPPRLLPEPILGKELTRNDVSPIRLMYIWAANPVAMLPDSQTVKKAIQSLEFSIVADPFLSDTAQIADLVIPTTTMLEEEELVGAYGHHFLANVRPVTEKPEGVLSDFQIFQQLADRLGMDPEFQDNEQQWKDKLMRDVFETGVTKESFETNYTQNPFAKKVMFHDKKFGTTSGKVNLVSQLPEGFLDLNNPDSLKLTSVSTRKVQGSQWIDPNPEGFPELAVHPKSASGFKDGENAVLESAKSSMRVTVRHDESQRGDIALIDKGGWLAYDRCANKLLEAQCSDLGDCAVYYDTEVQLKPMVD